MIKNFTCSKCGSSQLRPQDDHYVCEYCRTVVYKPATVSKNKLTLISIALLVLLISSFMVYKLLYSVKSDIQEIKQQTQVQQKTLLPEDKTVLHTEDNPFADLIVKVESGYQEKVSGNALEKAIKHYEGLENNKAFYIALDKNGEYAFGYAYSSKSIDEAESQALNTCEKEKKKRHLSDSCIPYAVNNRISRLIVGE